MEHLVKVHGGAMYQSWTNASIALHHLQGLDNRLSSAKERWDMMITQLNGIGGIRVHPIPNGCNIFHLQLESGYNGKRLATLLHEQYAIRIPFPDEQDGAIHLHVNETLLQRDPASVIAAFSAAVASAKV
jgi:threonine aldolase